VNYSFNFFYLGRSLHFLVDGLIITLELTIVSVAIGLALGFLLALARVSSAAVFRWPAATFIEFFRCTPALVQIVWFYYCTPIFLGVNLDAFTTVLIALALNVTAFNAEAYRAAMKAVPASHVDAAVALGLSRYQTVRYVVLPQSLRIAVPVLVSNAIGIFQQSSLVSLVAVADLMYRAKQLVVDTYRPIETLTVVALIYLAISLAVGQAGRWFEGRATRVTGAYG
jgi:polar amino acid transport system permease protein